MCDSNRMCNVARSKIAPAHAEPVGHLPRGLDGPVRYTPRVHSTGVVWPFGYTYIVPQPVQVGVFGRSLEAR